MKNTAFLSSCVLFLGAMVLTGCSDKPDASAQASATASVPAATATASTGTASTPAPTTPVAVSLVRAQQKDFAIVFKATGTVTPLTSVEVKAQLSNPVLKVHIREGQFVKAGELLFTLDARTEAANVAKARAQWAKDNASLADAQRQLTRAKQLLAQNFISQGGVDTAQALADAAAATVGADQAAIEASAVALSYARITAPNAGRAGAIAVSAGSTVQANTTPLVTITQLDPMGVAFSLPQRNLADALAALKRGDATVTATLADGGGSFQGRLTFIDNAVDPASGTVRVKAEFSNKDRKLWPGAFVEVAQTVSTLKDAVVIPQAAIVQSARGSVVYVVEDGKAALRPVQVLAAQGTDAAVTGVKAGDLIALDGKQNLRPGSLVAERTKDTAKESGKEVQNGSAKAGTAP